MSTELAKTDVKITGGLVQLQSMSEALTFCQEIFSSGLCPTSFKTKQAVFMALQTGGELGLSPMQSLQGLYAFNGRVAMMENCARGIAQHSGKLESIEDRFEGTGDDLTAICTIRRTGIKNTFVGRFSVSDAKRAKLWEKRNANGSESPWILYPKDMLKKKASARALRDSFGDVLIGLQIKEDIEDLPPEKRESVNPNPVHDPLIDALPMDIAGVDISGEIVDADFTTETVPERICDVEIPKATNFGAPAMRAAIQPEEPCADLEEQQAQGPKMIEGEIDFAKSRNDAYWNIKCGGKYYSWKHASNASTSAMVQKNFKAGKKKFRIHYTETPWEKDGKSGVNNTVVGIEARKSP